MRAAAIISSCGSFISLVLLFAGLTSDDWPLAAGLTSDSGQLTLAFIAADDNPALPGTTAAEVDPGIHGSIPVQRSGDSQAVREDGLRDKQTHPGDFSVLSADA